MKGVCFQEVGRVAVAELEDPRIEEGTDAIVQVHMAGLCGSDLHPFFGREPGLQPGTVMGHEFVGEVIEVGDAVKSFRTGDRVCAPFSTSCGECFYCRQGLTSRCPRGELFGWRSNGAGLHGGQAEQVRVPLADGTLVSLAPNLAPEFGLLLGDNLATGHFCANMAAVGKEGVYVVIGCGTVGLLCIAAALELGAEQIFAIDRIPERREHAHRLGATVAAEGPALLEAVRRATEGRGADAVMELVGLPEAQRLAIDALRPGGVLSVIGCHCTNQFAFSPVEAYDKNLTYRTGRCPARALMPGLAEALANRQESATSLITHRFPLDAAEAAYDVFANRRDGCVKAVLEMT